MQEKQDRRVRYTKMVLREALLDMLKSKTLNQISVAALCRAADVNRNTFYNHYNHPQAILEELETEMFDSLMSAIKDVNEIEAIILAACKTLENDKKMSQIIFSKTDATSILTNILESVKTRDIKGFASKKAKQQQIQEQVYTFGEQGTIALISRWVLSGFPEPAESVAKLTATLVRKLNETIKDLN